MDTMCMPSHGRQVTLYDRISNLLESVEWSDCSFLVGSEVIKAHKLILAISSPVFKVMLYGPLAQATEILVSDIEPDVFQLLLDFIYKDKVVINSLENACGLLYASKKYILPYLTEICLKYIEDTTSIENVLSIFNFSEWIQEEALIAHCLTLICKHADSIFANDFDHISGSCLRKILQQYSINMCEKSLAEVALQWAHNECLERELPPSTVNKRKMLIESGALASLRLLTLNIDDVNWLCSTSILSEDEMNILKENVSNQVLTKDPVQNKAMEYNKTDISNDAINSLISSHTSLVNPVTVPRNSMKLEWLFCCRPVTRTANPLLIHEMSQTIKVRIKSQKTVFVNSFSIPTRQSPEIIFLNESRSTYSEHINVVLVNNANKNDQISTSFANVVDYNSSIYIDLPKPYIFNEEEWYTVSFSWAGKISQLYKYPLCYRLTKTFNAEANFIFDDNYENIMPCGSFVEGLKFCV